MEDSEHDLGRDGAAARLGQEERKQGLVRKPAFPFPAALRSGIFGAASKYRSAKSEILFYLQTNTQTKKILDVDPRTQSTSFQGYWESRYLGLKYNDPRARYLGLKYNDPRAQTLKIQEQRGRAL